MRCIVLLKDGRTRRGYKAEHVVDLESGAVVAAEVYGADEGDTATLTTSLEGARENIDAARAESKDADPNDDDHDGPSATSANAERPIIEVVADKGYHRVELLFAFGRAEYQTYIPVRTRMGADIRGEESDSRG